MKRSPVALLVAAASLLTGCVTYQYYGEIDARNSDGREVKALAHWQKTERRLWFDTASGAVRVQTQCSLNTLVYNERDPWLPDMLICRSELAEPALQALWGDDYRLDD